MDDGRRSAQARLTLSDASIGDASIGDASPAASSPVDRPLAATAVIEAVIRRRRMTRRFSPEPLPPGLLDSLLDLARRAPTAGFSQGVHFLTLASDEARAGFWSTTGAGEWFERVNPGVLAAPAIVVPIGRSAEYTERYGLADKAGHGLDATANWSVPYWLTDAAMAAQNLLLLLEAAGFGALLFGFFRNEGAFLTSVGCPPDARAIGAIAVGWRSPDDRPSGSATRRARRPVEEQVHRDRW